MDINADVLKELVFYDPVTGEFTLRKETVFIKNLVIQRGMVNESNI